MEIPLKPNFWLFLKALWPQGKAEATGEAAAVIGAIYTFLGASIPSWLGWVLIAYVVLSASYRAWFHERKQHESTAQKLASYEHTPVKVQVLDGDNGNIICVKIVNHGTKEQRLRSLTLELMPIDNIKQTLPSRFIYKIEPASPSIRQVMPSSSMIEAFFQASRNGFLQYGIKSFWAKLEMEDGREIESPVVDISRFLDVETYLSRSKAKAALLEERLERQQRIDAFVDRYRQVYASENTGRFTFVPLMAFATANVLLLKDSEEIKQARQTIAGYNLPAPLEPKDFERDVRGFFMQYWGHGVLPGGWHRVKKLYDAWFNDIPFVED